jgi:hypothetical protein
LKQRFYACEAILSRFYFMLFLKQTFSSPLLTVYRDYTTRDAADSIMNINNILTKVKPVNRKHTRSKWPLAASQMTACKINHENTKGSKHERKAKDGYPKITSGIESGSRSHDNHWAGRLSCS